MAGESRENGGNINKFQRVVLDTLDFFWYPSDMIMRLVVQCSMFVSTLVSGIWSLKSARRAATA